MTVVQVRDVGMSVHLPLMAVLVGMARLGGVVMMVVVMVVVVAVFMLVLDRLMSMPMFVG